MTGAETAGEDGALGPAATRRVMEDSARVAPRARPSCGAALALRGTVYLEARRVWGSTRSGPTVAKLWLTRACACCSSAGRTRA